MIRDCQLRVSLAKYEKRRLILHSKREPMQALARKDIRPFLSTLDGRTYKDVVTARRRGDVEKNVGSVQRQPQHKNEIERNERKTIVVRVRGMKTVCFGCEGV